MQISLTRKKLIIEKIARRTSKDREKQLQSPAPSLSIKSWWGGGGRGGCGWWWVAIGNRNTKVERMSARSSSGSRKNSAITHILNELK